MNVKIKWSIFLTVGKSLSVFTQCIEKLVASVDPKRTEIIFLGEQTNKLLLDTFSYFCEQKNIPYFYGDDHTHALSMARGEYIVYLTDHTIVSKQFLVKLAFALENADKPTNKTALVSPVSNEVAPDLNITPENIDALQSGLAKQRNVSYDYTMNLSTFCIMAKKEVCRPQFNVRELILATNYSGFLTVSANDTLVFHYPEEIDETLNPLIFSETNNILGALYRVKIDEPHIMEVFVASLQKTTEFVDKIYICDDNSKIKIGLWLREKHPELWSKITKYEKFSRPYDERRDYNELIEWAEKDGCNWIISLEGDEIVENKVTKEYIQRLLKPVNPEIFGYKITHYHFYDSSDLWRMDRPWGNMADIRIARLFPGKRIVKPGVLAGQCGYVPSLPSNSIKESGIRVKNYGYVSYESRLKKKEFYEKIGIKYNNQVQKFDYLLKTNGMVRYPWIEDNTLTIYTPAKAGGDILWKWLDNVAYFADEVLVGNDSDQLSKDDLDLLSKYTNVRVIPTTMGDNFGAGRNTVIKEAKGDWIFQLDLDEDLTSYTSLRRIMDIQDYDAWMFAIDNHQKDGTSISTQTIRLFRNKQGVEYWGRLHETIDAHIKKFNWKISQSPIKMINYGYTITNEEEAYKKMQRYLSINLKQMKENPGHGMSYYSVALHFLDDNLIEDAIKLLEICVALMPNFPLAGLELGRNYLKKGARWINMVMPKLQANSPLKQNLEAILNQLSHVMPTPHYVAQGHCVGYFNIHADEAKWLRDHILDMEKKIEEQKTKMLERRAKAAVNG